MTDANYPAFAYIFRSVPQGTLKLWKVGACRRANPKQNAVEALRKRLAGMGPLPRDLDRERRVRWELFTAWGVRGHGQRAAKNAGLVEGVLLPEVAKSYKMWVASNGAGMSPYIKLRSTDYAKNVDRSTVDLWIENADKALSGFPEDARIERLGAGLIAHINRHTRRRVKMRKWIGKALVSCLSEGPTI